LLTGRTALVIAHRLSTIERADRILVLSNGVLRESGTHEELLKRPGLYRRLFELQYAAASDAVREAVD
jgi:ABC-type multidrug transport system fused ATPase/permease subunit